MYQVPCPITGTSKAVEPNRRYSMAILRLDGFFFRGDRPRWRSSRRWAAAFIAAAANPEHRDPTLTYAGFLTLPCGSITNFFGAPWSNSA
jgi:hypothetical protein